MEKNIKIFKTIAIVFIILTVSLISFVGLFRDKLNSKVNIIPEFSYGMEIAGTRELKFKLDTASEEKDIYVDDNGKYMGDVIEESNEEELNESAGISLQTTVDENEKQESEAESQDSEEQEAEVVAKAEVNEVKYKKQNRTVKSNEDEVLNIENYEKSKDIIQTRLEKAQIPEYNIRLDSITGELILEVPENEQTDQILELVKSQGKFEIIDAQTGVILLDNDDIKKASAVYYSNNGYQAFLQIEFKKDKVETLREISKTYVSSVDENDEETEKKVSLKLDGSTLMTTSFGDEMTQGILQITMGQETTDYDEFSKSYESASYFANLLDNGKTPNMYTLSSDNFVKSQITDDIIILAKVAFAGFIAIMSLVLIVRYKFNGILGAISSIGYIAITMLAIRYTNVIITLNSLIAIIGIVMVNYLFMFNFLERFKIDSKKHAFTEAIKEINITIIPLWVVAVIFTFMTNVAISSVGMVTFWGLFTQIIYSFIITRTLYVD